MNEFAPMLTGWSAGAASALLAAVWEGSLLAALVWLALRLLPRLSPSARSVVWLNVFILMALLHLVPLFTGAVAASQPLAAHALRLDPRWSLALAAVWLVFSLFRAGQLAAGALHLRRLGRRAQPLPVAAEIARLLQNHGRPVELCSCADVTRPSVLGFFRPRILIPPGLVERLSPVELKQVVLHEMEHLRRGDDWANLIQKLALVLFPLNPALAWVERRLCAERELACDDRVLDAGSGREGVRALPRPPRRALAGPPRIRPGFRRVGAPSRARRGASSASSTSRHAPCAAGPHWPPPVDWLPAPLPCARPWPARLKWSASRRHNSPAHRWRPRSTSHRAGC